LTFVTWLASHSWRQVLKVKMETGLEDAYTGASIAVNGVCLTLLEFPAKDGVAAFGVSPETIMLTNLVRRSSLLLAAAGLPANATRVW
jgi:riboflavin synthase alpha subunit